MNSFITKETRRHGEEEETFFTAADAKDAERIAESVAPILCVLCVLCGNTLPFDSLSCLSVSQCLSVSVVNNSD
jgi:hypothetical protein